MDTVAWTWRGVLCVSLACALALDSNTIRSKDGTARTARTGSPGNPGGRAVRRRTESGGGAECSGPECLLPARGSCSSNRAQRRPASQDRRPDRLQDGELDGEQDAGGLNRTKAPEMSSCVRSGDCMAGLCCVRYLTGRRCQRIPAEGEACLLRGSSKKKRNLGRCDCGGGLACAADPHPGLGGVKGQGVCVPRQTSGQRRTRHSGKKRRTAERGC